MILPEWNCRLWRLAATKFVPSGRFCMPAPITCSWERRPASHVSNNYRRLEDLPKRSILHFAVHGLLSGEQVDEPCLVLAKEGDAEDGLLKASEVEQLRIRADVVVLSSCQTGRGRLFRGEGVQGLARAFLQAGGQSVVCSLWSVDDDATADWMHQFYEQLQQGQRPAAAARAAQLKQIADERPPFFLGSLCSSWPIRGSSRRNELP